MFEILVAAIFTIIIVNVSLLWVKIFLLVLLVLLILPGVYAMCSGAPFVPSLKNAIDAMFKLGNFGENDVVYELGCGDGRIIRKVAEKGVKKAVGYEYSIPTCFFAKLMSIFEGKGEKIIFANFWKKDYRDADAIICFLQKDTMVKFKKVIWKQLKNGARVLSNYFPIPGVQHALKEGSVYYYVKK